MEENKENMVQNAEQENNQNNNNVQRITASIINCYKTPSTDGNTYIACDLEGGVEFPTKKSVKSFIRHLVGNTNCVNAVVDELNKQNISILNGCKVVLEQKKIAANETFVSSTGENIVKDKDWTATRTIAINVDSIATVLLDKEINAIVEKGGNVTDAFINFKMKMYGIA